jgi:hypothetical protein
VGQLAEVATAPLTMTPLIELRRDNARLASMVGEFY